MSSVNAAQVRTFLSERYADGLAAAGRPASDLPDDFDLLTEGIIDSFGILEMIGAMEEHFGIQIDFEAIDPGHLTVIGPLARFVEAQTTARTSGEG